MRRTSLSWRRAVGFAAIAVLVTAGVLVTRAVWAGRNALADGDAAARRGDHVAAITAWRRAARWYLPGAPHVDIAYDRLEQAAHAAEEAGDTATAIAAWRGIVSSSNATRGLWAAQAARAGRARVALDALLAEPPRTAKVTLDLAVRNRPALAWLIVALLGLVSWLGGAALLATRGLDEDDRLARRPAAAAATLIAIGVLIWCLSLLNA